ncbi:DUF2202 domain-containing protein [Corynebacterium sp. H130]|uniref:DUF2202 domain-containing protein n=1 Tax=Corynebacterium sp. H130 TaxID=3133444 RepID=UPI0030B5FD11
MLRRKATASVIAGVLAMTLGVVPANADIATEGENLRIMYEEERMAHDLYVALADMWGPQKFSNIARAETRHQNIMGAQLDRIGVARPDGQTPGEYEFEELNKLYADWLARGGESQQAAFEVGAELERRDIADLQKVKGETDDPQLIGACDKLIAGSERHLAAFEGKQGDRPGKKMKQGKGERKGRMERSNCVNG